MTKEFVVFFSVLFLISSCSPSELKPKEYIQWCDNVENGLIKEQKIGDQTLTCYYTTPEYVSLKQSDPDNIVEDIVKENIAGLEEMEHFKLTFQRESSNNYLRDNYTTEEEFHTKSTYMSFDIRFDLKLVQGADTTECILNHHERTYGNTPFETILISFPKTKSEEVQDLTLIFDDRVFGFDRVKFKFPADVIDQIPTLVF